MVALCQDLLVTRESDTWPPSDFNSWYVITERIVGQPEVSFDFVLPATFSEVDLSTVRIGRHGGPNAEDLEFRAELYRRIGAVVVAAGQVEMAMKRLLLASIHRGSVSRLVFR